MDPIDINLYAIASFGGTTPEGGTPDTGTPNGTPPDSDVE